MGCVYESLRLPVGNLQFLTVRGFGAHVRRECRMSFQLRRSFRIQSPFYGKFPGAPDCQPLPVFRHRHVYRQRINTEYRLTVLPSEPRLGQGEKRR